MGASNTNLVEIYTKHIRPALEFSVPVWHPSLNNECSALIEKVQKCACKIILQDKYDSYSKALKALNLHIHTANIWNCYSIKLSKILQNSVTDLYS